MNKGVFVLEVTGYVKLPRIRRGQFHSNKDTDINCRIVYDKLYIHANWGDNAELSLLKGQAIMTVKSLAESCYWLTRQNVRTCLNILVTLGLIKMERASKYREDGYKITLLEYYNFKLSTACGTNHQLTNALTNALTNGGDDLRAYNDDGLLMYDDDCQPTPQPTPQPSTNLTLTNKVIRITNNTLVADTASTPPSKPKRTRKKSELPEWVTKLYLSKLAEHCNQTLEKVDSADIKKLNELFKVVSDESRMSQLFTYYFTLQDDFYKKKGYPLAILVKNQATFFRAMSVITPQQGKLRKATV